MGKTIDFNYIFFGRHERKRRIIKLVLIYLIAFVVIYYGYRPAESTNIIQESAEEKIKKEIRSRETVTEPRITAKPVQTLCNKFQAVEGEVTCEEAVQLALEKYPVSKNTAGMMRG